MNIHRLRGENRRQQENQSKLRKISEVETENLLALEGNRPRKYGTWLLLKKEAEKQISVVNRSNFKNLHKRILDFKRQRALEMY